MIRVPFFQAIAVYLFFVLSMFFWAWWKESGASRHKKFFESSVNGRIWRCPYCATVSVDYYGAEILKCPVCESYSEGE